MIVVKHQGVHQDHTGYGEANRNEVAALHTAGIDVAVDTVHQVREKSSFGWTGELCKQLEGRNIPYKIKIIHLTPDLYKNYMEDGVYHISRLFWETDSLPAGWADACNQMGEIWASSPNMAELFKANGVRVPIYSFPQPIDITHADKNYTKFSVSHHSGFLFYAIFQWIDRKNPRALLTAFWEAFKGRDDVALLLKTFRLSYDEGEYEKIRDDIRQWKSALPMGHYPKILLVNKILTQEEMYKLHTTGDCFVQADCGEGWSRTVQEALLMGKPVIATSRGGIHEYLQEEHYFKIPSKYVPVREVNWIKFYTKDQKWAEIDKEKLKLAMLYCYNNRILAGAKGIVAKQFIKHNFSYAQIGNKMRERLEKIQKTL